MSSNQFNIPRHWWGKILGGVLGLFKGGISGALIGVLFGHIIDRFIAGFIGVSKTQEVFFDALFSALGHLSKADGVVTQTEIQMVETLMQRMNITGDHRQRAIRLFNRGKQDDFDLEHAMRPFVQHSAVRMDLRQMFTEILIEAAFSSGKVSQQESEILLKVARMLRIPGNLFAAMMNARTGTGGAYYQEGARRSQNRQVGTLDQSYAKLGLTRKASDAEVKKAYRKLVSQYHPDKLVSHGLPEEMMEIAKTKVREINLAYDQIKQTRGFK